MFVSVDDKFCPTCDHLECHLSMNELFFGGWGWVGEWVLWMRMSVYSFKSLIAICHNVFVNCDAINVLDYQISLIEKKKKNWLFWIKVVIFIDKYKHHFVMLFSLMKFFDLHWKSMKIDEIGALWLMVKQ